MLLSGVTDIVISHAGVGRRTVSGFIHSMIAEFPGLEPNVTFKSLVNSVQTVKQQKYRTPLVTILIALMPPSLK